MLPDLLKNLKSTATNENSPKKDPSAQDELTRELHSRLRHSNEKVANLIEQGRQAQAVEHRIGYLADRLDFNRATPGHVAELEKLIDAHPEYKEHLRIAIQRWRAKNADV